MRKVAPMPIGSVFIQWPEMTYDDIRRHFRTMKELGFTCLKGITCWGAGGMDSDFRHVEKA